MTVADVKCGVYSYSGYVERNDYELYVEKALENVVNSIKGTPTNIVNPEVFDQRAGQ